MTPNKGSNDARGSQDESDSIDSQWILTPLPRVKAGPFSFETHFLPPELLTSENIEPIMGESDLDSNENSLGKSASSSVCSVPVSAHRSIFLQDVAPLERRAILAEHEKFVRKQKMKISNSHVADYDDRCIEPADLRECDNAATNTEESDMILASKSEDSVISSGGNIKKRIRTTDCGSKSDSENNRQHRHIRRQGNNFDNCDTNMILSFLEPHVLRLSVYEKYLCLSTAFCNQHDTAFSLRNLFQVSYAHNIVQYHRVWVPVPTPNGKLFPHLASFIKNEGYEDCLATFEDLFLSYPDSVFEYFDLKVYPTAKGVKLIARLLFTGRISKSKEKERFPSIPEIPDELCSESYSTIFFDHNNRIYEIWNDSIIPLSLTSMLASTSTPQNSTPTADELQSYCDSIGGGI